MNRLFPFSIFLIPFINFSPVPSSNISFSMIGALLCFIGLLKNKKIFISHESFIFIVFCFLLIISQILSSDTISNKYFSQIINIWVVVFCFIAFNSLAMVYKKELIYECYFRYGFVICLISFCFFVVAFIAKSDAALLFVRFFNNSGNFDGIGVNLWAGNLLTEVRMNLFFPEPSFFSMYIATLIGVGIILNKPKKIILTLIFFLLLTVGRTGFLAVFILFLALLFIKIFKPNKLIRGFIGTLLLVLPIFAYLLIFSYLTSFDYSFFQRIDSISNAYMYAQESLVYGHGYNTYANEMRVIGYHSGDVFNFPLNLLITGGLLVTVPFFLLIFYIFFNSSIEEFPMLCSIMGILSTIPTLNIYFLILIMAVACSNKPFKYSSQ